jgi:hypothetical protein
LRLLGATRAPCLQSPSLARNKYLPASTAACIHSLPAKRERVTGPEGTPARTSRKSGFQGAPAHPSSVAGPTFYVVLFPNALLLRCLRKATSVRAAGILDTGRPRGSSLFERSS